MSDIKILAVDDSPTMRRIIVNTLNRAGFNDIVEAVDGKEALAKLSVDQFDVLITDWNMPEMDGLTLVQQVRKDDRLKALPILMITTRSVKEDIMKALKAGVNSYIVKPFTAGTLKEKIEKVLSEKKTSGEHDVKK